jgi:hypothetical protein
MESTQHTYTAAQQPRRTAHTLHPQPLQPVVVYCLMLYASYDVDSTAQCFLRHSVHTARGNTPQQVARA